MAQDFSRLENIFRMINPAVAVDAIGSSAHNQANSITKRLLELLFEVPGGGVLPADKLLSALTLLTAKSTDQQLDKEFNKTISVLGSDRSLKPSSGLSWPYLAYDGKTRRVIEVKSTRELFGKSVDSHYDLAEKPFSIITINSPMVSPQRRDAERAELFLNSIPSIVMSRCVPFVELEFGFNRPGDGTSRTQLQTTSLMKFLLGADDTSFGRSANKEMIEAHRILSPQQGTEYSTSGMELFTAPQTLTNMDPASTKNRYVQALDPFRPLASLLSVTIDVKPTVGVYSFKKAQVQLRLHDRSRLSEIADLIKPTVYTQTTVWLTYGWRHPFEPDNPYATFINNNLLRREAFGLYNSDFSFDANGQVDITLELYTKAASEVKTVKISQNLKEYSDKLSKLQELANEVNRYREVLKIDDPRSAGVEVRGSVLLEAAGKGIGPDFALKGKKDDILSMIKGLERDLKKSQTDITAVDRLVGALKKMYVDSSTEKAAYAEVARGLRSAIKSQFDEARTGLDPYLMFDKKNEVRRNETSSGDHPFVKIMRDKLNENANQIDLRRRYASFAKVFSVFIANSIMTIPGIDEIQTLFYQLNSAAGLGGGTNIAEFPVDLDMFQDAYAEEVESKGSDSFTIEEFLNLIIRTQIDDMRSLAYGFTAYFEPYDSKNPSPSLKESQKTFYEAELDNLTTGRGKFQKPQVEVFMETVFAADESSSPNLDLLQAYTSANSEGSVNREKSKKVANFKRVLRIHVYDKTLNPYEQSTARSTSPHQNNNITVSNKMVSDYVSRNVPTIVYGSNASTVISAELATKRDPLLVASQLVGLNKNKRNTMEPNGSNLGGLPLRVLPAQLSMRTLGCPLLNYSQFMFVDFKCGTTLSNIYGISGLTHTLTPGKFESQIQFAFYDAYGQFESGATSIENILKLKR
jgi:hypothetical protein